jgi:hypothetical protein
MKKKERPTRDKENNSQWRLGVTFHRTFSLIRPALTQVLQLATRTGELNGGNEGIERKLIRELTNLGTIYVEAMPRYCYGSGLLNQQYALTDFGNCVVQHDSMLEQEGTQWLMHYHLSAPQGPGPAFWHELVITRFRSGERFTGVEIADQIGAFVQTTTGKAIAPRSVRSTATVFLGTYHKLDGLGKLGILKEETKDSYRVLTPSSPPLWALAYALMDYWNAHYGQRLTINLSDLSTERGFASPFLLGEEQLLKALNELQTEGIVELYRVAQPYQVVLLQTNPAYALQRMYQA